MLLTLLFAASPAQAATFGGEASLQASTQTLALDGRARVEGEKDAYVSAAARYFTDGEWIGRVGAGVDLLGKGDVVDLKLGLTAGGVGYGKDRPGLGTVGGELQLGVHLGPVYGSLRHMDGFVGPFTARLTEDEVRVGAVLPADIRLYGQFVDLNPGDDVHRGLVGVGLEFSL